MDWRVQSGIDLLRKSSCPLFNVALLYWIVLIRGANITHTYVVKPDRVGLVESLPVEVSFRHTPKGAKEVSCFGLLFYWSDIINFSSWYILLTFHIIISKPVELLHVALEIFIWFENLILATLLSSDIQYFFFFFTNI